MTTHLTLDEYRQYAPNCRIVAVDVEIPCVDPQPDCSDPTDQECYDREGRVEMESQETLRQIREAATPKRHGLIWLIREAFRG